MLGINLLYELALVFLLFQDLDSARNMMTYLDPNLGVPLPEKSYADNCEFTATNIWVSRTIQGNAIHKTAPFLTVEYRTL